MSTWIGAIIIVLCLLTVGFVLFRGVRAIHGNFDSSETVQATLVNKQTYVEEQYVANMPSYRRKYVLTFLCEGKTLYFDVSSETYESVELKQQGILEYSGARFLNFD